jgi:hypothetical protein
MALAMEWVSRITTVALEMVLPGIGGQWIDARYGTSVFGPIGFVLGLVVGMWHLLRMTKSLPHRPERSELNDAPPKAGKPGKEAKNEP